MNKRVWLEIDMGAIRRNYRRICDYVSPCEVMCVLKANAYGLGVAAYAKHLGANFGVAEPFEAIELKRVRPDARVQILSSILPDEIDEMVALGIVLPVIDLAGARMISGSAVRQGKCAKVHVKIDSGMGRLGIRLADAMDVVREVAKLPGLEMEGIFSHCPMAYDPENPFTARQIAEFASLVGNLASEGICFKYVHIAASDAINNFPESRRAPFNLVRTGINLHGSFDPNGRKALNVERVLSLKTRVAQVRTLPAGATLGYGRTWCLDRPARIATISAGYADGLPLALTNRGHVLIGGNVCPIVGRISMDYTTVDVSGVEGVKAGDEVVCLGASGGHSVSPDDWAAIKGTHAYDIICSFGTRVERRVKE